MDKKIKRMFQVYWMLFVATGFIIFAIIRQLLCECLYLEIGGALALFFITISIIAYTATMRKKIKR